MMRQYDLISANSIVMADFTAVKKPRFFILYFLYIFGWSSVLATRPPNLATHPAYILFLHISIWGSN
jgi:hypothetical protein